MFTLLICSYYRFSHFDLEATPKCWSDALGVYDISEDGERLIGQYCGENVPNLLRTRGNKMKVTFVSDGSPHAIHTGFNASYYSQGKYEFVSISVFLFLFAC